MIDRGYGIEKGTRTNPPSPEALAIYQDRLDALSRTLMAGQFSRTPAFYNLPTQIRTLRAEMVIETADEIEAIYTGFVETQRSNGLTDLLWLASEARWLSPDYLEGFHVTHLLSNGAPLLRPYQSRMVLRDVGGVWKIDELETELNNVDWPIDPVILPDGQPLDAQHFKYGAEDARVTVADPLAVYDKFLRAYSACNMAGDFDGWAAMHLFPHMVHSDEVDKTIKAPEGLRGFFDILSGIIENGRCDRFERRPSRAEFLSANQIIGYHTGTIYRGDEIVLGPIDSRMILQRVGPKWLLKSVTNAVANHEFPYTMPLVSGKLVALKDIRNRRRDQ